MILLLVWLVVDNADPYAELAVVMQWGNIYVCPAAVRGESVSLGPCSFTKAGMLP